MAETRTRELPRSLLLASMTTMMLCMKTRCAVDATGSRLGLFAVVIAVGLVGAAGCSSGNASAPSTPTPSAAPPAAAPSTPLAAAYHSPDGYSISPPADWILHPTDGQDGLSVLFGAPTVDKAAPKPFVDNLNVVITATPENLDSLVSETKQKYPSVLKNYKVVTDQPITLPNGQPAHLLGGTSDDERSGSLENIQLILVSAGKEYTITFTSPAASFDSYHDLIQASLASFTLG
jgi:hypothetical protein